MDVEIRPEPSSSERLALLEAIERLRRDAEGDRPYRQAWRDAGLREAIGDEEADRGYAFSPRSTRGATRA